MHVDHSSLANILIPVTPRCHTHQISCLCRRCTEAGTWIQQYGEGVMADKRTRHTKARTGKTFGILSRGSGGGDVDELQQQSLQQMANLCQHARDKGKPISLFNARRLLRRILAQASA